MINVIQSIRTHRVVASLCLASILTFGVFCDSSLAQQDPQSDSTLRTRVKRAIRHGTDFLRRRQLDSGIIEVGNRGAAQWNAGLTALAVLAQINCDIPVESKAVQRSLEYLRQLRTTDLLQRSAVYEASLVLMALCAADQPDRNLGKIREWTRHLERSQITSGGYSGLWGYTLGENSAAPDRSNGQFAVLALRDAAHAGVRIDPQVLQRIKEQWETYQNSDGGWGYKPGDSSESRGSMTAAGLSTVAIVNRMIADDSDVDADGRVDDCQKHVQPEAIVKGRHWLGYRAPFSVQRNPGGGGPDAHYYYLYGLERAARLTNVRFFGEHDWYRAGARLLTQAQLPNGSWSVSGSTFESEPVMATSFALLFLSKGLSRVVVNKLDYSSLPQQEKPQGDWNRHYLDIPNLIDHIDALPGWPPRLNSQNLELHKLEESTAVLDLNQAPVLYVSGSESVKFSDQQVGWLRQYIDEGGFIFAQANCSGGNFDIGFRDLVLRMFPNGEAELKKLEEDHPVFRSEYLLPQASLELYGVDFGCRTPIVYSPVNHARYWQKWMRRPPDERSVDLTQRIDRSMRLGVNVIAYATGREPPEKMLEDGQRETDGEKAVRGLQEIAQLRHDGGWDTAPKAVRNLLQALQKSNGIGVSLEPRAVSVSYDALSKFPMVYMHGRYGFRLKEAERRDLRDYLDHGALLMADACCGSQSFDRSFRELMKQLYPDHPLEPIPADHVMFTRDVGFETRLVKRRQQMPASGSASLRTQIQEGPPLLEGIQVNGQYVVVYSRYDLSCALENQASLACDGYLEEDAVRLAVNVVKYGLFVQSVTAPSPDDD